MIDLSYCAERPGRIAVRFVLLLAMGLGGAFASIVRAGPPELTYFTPAGAARGSTVEVTANGDFPRWPVQVWTSHAGLKLSPESDKGKFKLEASSDVPPGIHWIRCLDDEGASAPRPVCIGTIPEVQEAEPNDLPEKWQAVTCPATVNGRLRKNGDVDAFVLQLSAGQTLVASLQANSELGSPMDGVLQIAWIQNASTGNESAARREAFVLEQVDDSVGLDPRSAFTVPRDGAYLVRVFAFPLEPNSTIGFAGNENYVYRLTLTTGGFVDHARPLVIQRGTTSSVELSGWNLTDDQKQVEINLLPDADHTIAFRPEYASHAVVGSSDLPVVNRSSSQVGPMKVSYPVAISGCLQKRGERHEYLFAAAKDEKLNLRVDSRSLGFSADTQLVIKDSAGKVVEEKDDGGSRRNRNLDPATSITVPADGEYQIVIDDVYGDGSDRHVYQLTIDKVSPRVSLTVGSHGYVVAAGKTVEIPVTIDRQDGFVEPLQIVPDGLPAGVTAAAVTSEKEGSTAKEVKLTISADAAAAKWSGPIRVSGVTSDGKKYPGRYRMAEQDADRIDVWLTITPAAP